MKKNEKTTPTRSDICGIEDNILKTQKHIESIKKTLLKGKNQRRLSLAEKRLAQKREELEAARRNAAEQNERKKEKLNINISQLESTVIVLKERLALLNEEYGRLKGQSRKTADDIVRLETEHIGCSEEIGKELGDELGTLSKDAGSIRKSIKELENELNTALNDIAQQRKNLDALEKYKPLPVETDREYISIEKELAYRTARRDYLQEIYSEELKKLDELNCQLYRMSLARENRAGLHNTTKQRKE